MLNFIRFTHFPRWGLVAALIGILPLNAWAEAYCALRDPVSSIKQLFPASTGHRSIVRTIDETTRQQVLERLPRLPLHFGELGRHTLYVALEGATPVGLVHVRSEQSSSGLVEIAWALNMDLTIRDFVFQRCRSRQKKVLQQADFKVQFMGKDLQAVQAFYDQSRNQGTQEYLDMAGSAKELANVLLKCAMKTLVVTETAWQGDLVKLAHMDLLQLNGLSASNLISVPVLKDESSLNQLKLMLGESGVGIDRHSVSGFLLQDDQGELNALLYLSQANIDEQRFNISWLFDLNGQILGVESRPDWPTAQVKNLFEQTRNQSYADPQQCSNRAELFALEASLTMQPYFISEP